MWVEVQLETEALRADALADALIDCGAISASVEDAHAGTDLETPQFGEPDGTENAPPTPLWERSRVLALFEPAADLRQRIATVAGIADPATIALTEVAEQDWVRLTQSQFEPIRVNARLWIVPSWHVAPDRAARVPRAEAPGNRRPINRFRASGSLTKGLRRPSSRSVSGPSAAPPQLQRSGRAEHR